MLRTRSLTFSYDENTSFDFPDLQLESGEKMLLFGESGVGKTTFLHLIAGLLRPNTGSVELKGTMISELPSSQLDRYRGENIGLVFQSPHFVQAINVLENLSLVQYLAKKPQDKKRSIAVLQSLGVADKKFKKPNQLSQGEQQRVSIAMAVINSPQLILADEPTASLDDKNCKRVVDLLKEQAEASNSQLIIITHDQRLRGKFQHTVTL
jgi:ABC-type lipoprotein export system ATPase subunit